MRHRYIYQDQKATIVFTSLHEALKYINTHKHATIREGSTGRLIDKTPEKTRTAAQSLLSQVCDALNLEHIKIEDIYQKDGKTLEEAISSSLNRQEILDQSSAGTPYVRALIHFFMVDITQKLKGK